MPGVKIQLDVPSDGNSIRTPMVDGDPGQVIKRINHNRFPQKKKKL